MKKGIGKKVISSIALCSMLCYTAPVFALTKEETVYSKLDNDGKSYNTIVSTHIKNEELLQVINDMSDLLNIKNVGGDETFSIDNNTVVWNAGENDIYYQGESTKSLPVETSIKYELNGEEMSAKDIVGKAGKVKVTIEYENKDSHIVKVNGKNETLYTPFITITGTAIDNKVNKNIEITNGKLIEKDGNTIAIGIAFPGMEASLNTNRIEIPENIEISMDTECFELDNILTYITPKILDDEDEKLTSDLKEIYDAVDEMKEASEQIEEGANTLKEGTENYAEKSEEFTSYMGELAEGTTKAEAGAKQVQNGVNQLASKSEALVPGVTKIAEGTSTLKEKINYAAESTEKLAEGATSIDNGIQDISAGINTISQQLSSVDVSKIPEQVQSLNLLKTNLENMNKALDAQIQAATAEENKELATLLTNQKAMNELSIKSIESNISSLQSMPALKTGINKIKAGLDGNAEKPGLVDGAKSLDSNLNTLSSGLNEMNSKVDELVAGTQTLSTSAGSLISGIKQIKTGTTSLTSGVATVNQSTNQLYNASTQLTDGSKTIAEGAVTLSEGITTFNAEAIDKIYTTVNGEVKDLTDRIDCLNELSKQYVNFAMKDEEMNGNVKFILMTDPLKKEEN
mgnify:CR=1 FL=1